MIVNTGNHLVTPHTGVWIETFSFLAAEATTWVTPHTGVWIETCIQRIAHCRLRVTPHTGVWIETRLSLRPLSGRLRHPPYGGVD